MSMLMDELKAHIDQLEREHRRWLEASSSKNLYNMQIGYIAALNAVRLKIHNMERHGEAKKEL